MTLREKWDLNRKKKRERAFIEKERAQYHKEVLKREIARKNEERIAPSNSHISLVNVNKIYPNHVQAVYDFNLDIKPKDFIVLVGPSGCGKSTTLRMIAGLEDITSGDLFLNGEYSNDLTPKERNIAMVFQSYALYPHMTVKENMSFGLKINHTPKEEIEKRVNEVAKILELEDYLDRKPDALSGGQCQRVALGRAIVRNSKIFLMDEPLSNLDAKLRVSMRSEIIKLHQGLGATTVYVTHDQTEAMTMATKIVIMNKGYVQQIGSPSEIYSHPANLFVASFIGSPAMNILNVKVNDNTIEYGNGYSIKMKQNISKILAEFYADEAKKMKEYFEQQKNLYLEREIEKPTLKDASISDEEKKEILFKYNLDNNVELKNKFNTYIKVDSLSKDKIFEVKFGIRPENISAIKFDKKDIKKDSSFVSNVVVSELLGNEYYLHFDFSEKEEITVKKQSLELISAGDAFALEFNADVCHIFDPITQKRVI